MILFAAFIQEIFSGTSQTRSLTYIFFIFVTLTGEHIDYCGYSVLPMAIEQNILAAVSVNNSGKIQLANANPKYK